MFVLFVNGTPFGPLFRNEAEAIEYASPLFPPEMFTVEQVEGEPAMN